MKFMKTLSKPQKNNL